MKPAPPEVTHLLDCEVERDDGERLRVDVRCEGGRVAAIEPRGTLRDARDAGPVVEGAGGALLPALHDHHLHLMALAATRRSVDCARAGIRDEAALRAAIANAAGEQVRVVGYHESIAGELDRNRLDALGDARPLRVQHRTGAMWIWSGAALAASGLAGALPSDVPEGAERDAHGQATGRFFRLDDWLARRFAAGVAAPDDPAADVAATSCELAACGVAGLTDATPRNDAAVAALFADWQRSGALLQRVRLMGGPELAKVTPPGASWLAIGERKLVLDEPALPELDAFAAEIARAHGDGRCVAIHCVTRAEIVLAAGALAEAGVRPGDRIEHASIAPPDVVEWLASLGVAVVTQPGFVAARGDDYLRDVEERDREWLYRCDGFDRGGVPLGGGTDAPYGDADPWQAIRAPPSIAAPPPELR